MSAAISIVPLLLVPLALGMGLLTRHAGVGTQWWFGVTASAMVVVVGHGIGLPQSVVLALVFGAVLVLPVRTLRRLRRPFTVTRREILSATLLTALLLPLALAAALRTLDRPALGADAIVIWYAKAKALYEWVPVSRMPFENYPELGPAAWMLVLKWVGVERENVGRLIFVLPYFFWFFSLRELLPRSASWVSALVAPALSVLFFDFDRFTRGDQDGLVMMAAGMAALLMVKVVLQISTGEHAPDDRLAVLMATTHGRHDCFLAVFFAGTLGLIKQEGAVLGLILVVMWLSTLLAHVRPSGWPRVFRCLLPHGLIYLALVVLWPAILLRNGVNLAMVQGDAFTVSSVVHAFDQLGRWPSIRPYFVDHFAAESRLLIASMLLSVVAAWFLPKARTALVLLWGVWGLHGLFVFYVFLATRQPVEWHLGTAFDRLILQGRFALATLLYLTIVMLSLRMRSRRQIEAVA